MIWMQILNAYYRKNAFSISYIYGCIECGDYFLYKYHGTGTEICYQDPSALPWSKMATATTGKDVYTAIIPRQWWLDLV